MRSSYCNKLTWPACDPIKTSSWSAVNFKKHTSWMSSKPEPAIWSCDTAQQIPWFGRCQLALTWMSHIKYVCCKPWLRASVDPLAGVFLPCCATLFLTVGCSHSPPLAMLTNEKELHGFLFLCRHVVLFPQLRGSTWWTFGPPELRWWERQLT